MKAMIRMTRNNNKVWMQKMAEENEKNGGEGEKEEDEDDDCTARPGHEIPDRGGPQVDPLRESLKERGGCKLKRHLSRNGT